jgi:hypothetical protein
VNHKVRDLQSSVCSRRHQILDPDRKTAHPDSGGVPDRIGNGAGRAGDADFADALDAERVHMGIVAATFAALRATFQSNLKETAPARRGD